MNRIITSADEAIDAMGGPRRVSKLLGSVGENAVGNWRERGFPSHRRDEIKNLLRRHRLKFSLDVFHHRAGKSNGGPP